MNKLIILNIDMNFDKTYDKIYPAVFCDATNSVLVDCGYVGSLPKIEEALHCNDIYPEAITHIIITHQDHDHVGAAAAFKNKYPKVKILASVEEAPYISGARKSLRLEQAEQLQKELPTDMQEFGRTFCSLLRSVEPVQIDHYLHGDERLPFCGGCQVISTPGHTPGHISLYLSEFNTIISGDAIALEEGEPVIANPQFTIDLEKANASMQLLLAHPAQKIVCYHGGVLEKNT
jgi:glyoxylase-like metal-dependent hydrolase (beta-lactamase superfamily II)